jgi:hypothetical protein
MDQARCVRWVNRQIKYEAETIEIRLQMVVYRITMIEFTMSGELLTDQRPEPRPHLGSDDLGGFRVEIAAEALEVRAEQHNVAAQIFIDQMSIRGHRRQGGGALEVNLLEARHPIILPEQQRGGWQGKFPPVNILNT